MKGVAFKACGLGPTLGIMAQAASNKRAENIYLSGTHGGFPLGGVASNYVWAILLVG